MLLEQTFLDPTRIPIDVPQEELSASLGASLFRAIGTELVRCRARAHNDGSWTVVPRYTVRTRDLPYETPRDMHETRLPSSLFFSSTLPFCQLQTAAEFLLPRLPGTIGSQVSVDKADVIQRVAKLRALLRLRAFRKP